jgi:hypothetical protein
MANFLEPGGAEASAGFQQLDLRRDAASANSNFDGIAGKRKSGFDPGALSGANPGL